MWIIVIICIYFAALMFISRLTQRRADNQTFFRAERRSPWYMVAFGMVGASISGVTFVSVPGMVLSSQMTYLQVCLGFIVGYLVWDNGLAGNPIKQAHGSFYCRRWWERPSNSMWYAWYCSSLYLKHWACLLW